MRILEWLFSDGTIKGFLKRFGLLILTLLGLSTYIISFTYLINTFVNKQNDGVILSSMSIFNSIVFMSMPAIILIIISIGFILRKVNRNNGYRRKSNYTRVIYLTSIVLLIGILIYSANNYILIYKDKVVFNSIIPYFEKNYSYDDIKEVYIGVNRARRYPNLYYKLIFIDGRKINISSQILDDTHNIDKLIEVNNKIIENKVSRNIDDKYLEVLIVDYNEELKEKYRSLLK